MTREEFIKKWVLKKVYLGDGLYARFEGYSFILSAERESLEHWVGLEPAVFDALLEFRKQVYEDADSISEED